MPEEAKGKAGPTPVVSRDDQYLIAPVASGLLPAGVEPFDVNVLKEKFTTDPAIDLVKTIAPGGLLTTMSADAPGAQEILVAKMPEGHAERLKGASNLIVERDIGRLAKYTFDMGGVGDLLSLSLNVPPWEDLHELSPAELRLTRLVTTDSMTDVLPPIDSSTAPVAELTAKPVQDRFPHNAAAEAVADQPQLKPTKTAEALVPTGGASTAPAR